MYKIIVVDDESLAVKLNIRCLDKCSPMEVVGTFSNGRDALNFIKNGNKVDLVLLDNKMPVMDGLETLKQLRMIDPTPSVIAITACTDSRTVSAFLEYGVVDYLTKPFTDERLNFAIERFFSRHEAAEKSKKLSQHDIDLLSGSVPIKKGRCIKKGINEETLGQILDYLSCHPNEYMRAEQISGFVSLSKVTVRVYMNYLVEQGHVMCKNDFSTGGRPAITYKFIG